MKRAYRLRRPDQFRRARREGRTVTTPLLTLNVVAGRRRRTRCGFVVTKRLGTAVRRNRAKRRVREAVRLALPAITPGYDLVFVVRGPEVLVAPFPAIRQAVEQLLRRAQLWQEARIDPGDPVGALQPHGTTSTEGDTSP
ncbi:MAG: ribonuclease P protein component [Chloroflexales bacterium]|nr:ribonuclease P protein component [Chloroflexales bacterium]